MQVWRRLSNYQYFGSLPSHRVSSFISKRMQHNMANGDGAERPPNRLIHEKSPYLLQHAYNPVDWYAWGEEAFQIAVEKDRP